MEQVKSLKLIQRLFSSSDSIKYDEESTTIFLETDTSDGMMVSLFEWMNENSICMEYTYNGELKDDFEEIPTNEIITLHIDASYLRTSAHFNFYYDANDFLSKNRINLITQNYFISELKLSNISDENEEFFQYYNAICKLHKVINNLAVDIIEESSFSDVKYTIFDRRKLTIDSQYSYEDLLHTQTYENFFSIVDELYDETISETDKRANSLFLINALEIVFTNKKEITFSEILNNIQEIHEEYQIHHRAYLNSLEPGKLKEAFEKNIQESIGKLNTLLSDINNKMIFLPLAFIVSLGQLSNQTQAKNIIILLGMFIFCLLVDKFSTTQMELLKIIKDDIDDKENSFKSSTLKFFKELEPKITRLSHLADTVDDRFKWTIRLTWIIFIIVFIAVIYYAIPLKNIAHYFCDLNCTN